MIAFGISLLFFAMSLAVLWYADHTFKCAVLMHNETRALWRKHMEAPKPALEPASMEPPYVPAPEPETTPPAVTVRETRPPGQWVHASFGPCAVCGTDACREALTQPRAVPRLPSPDDAPDSTPTRMGLGPIAFVTRVDRRQKKP